MLPERSRAAAAALLLATLAAGCGPSHAPSRGSAPLPVAVTRAAAGDVDALVLPARVKAQNEVTLSARVPGRVTRFFALEGDAVRAGAPLAQFDSPEARRALVAAESDTRAARAQLAVAARQHARVESLFAAALAAAVERDAAAAAHDAAEARTEGAIARLEELRAALTIRAPFAGAVVRRHVDPGVDVQPGAPLLDVRSAGAADVVVAVPEGAVESIARARLEVQIGDDTWLPATLTRLDGMVDPATRTRTAHLAIARTDAIGAFARVRIAAAGGGDRTITVPTSSIVRRGALTGVYVVDGDRAWLRWIKVGREDGGRTQVLAGLTLGTPLVTSPAASLTDGARVAVRS